METIQRFRLKLTCPGLFILLYGYVSIKIQQVWYLGEARKHLFCQ